MNVVYLIQAGDNGPIRLGTTTDRGLRRHIAALQKGNAEQLAVLDLFDGDERLERRLHVTFTDQHVRGDWYSPDILFHIPDDVVRVDVDPDDEQRRLAAMELAEIERAS